MTTGRCVIGACFGDEGKGLMTDYFASRAMESGEPACVVRASGGVNAGHTVVTPDGKRHVHHHVGSGTLAGADTFLGRRFITNPLLFNKEVRELESMDLGCPLFYFHTHGRVTTWADMLLNEMIESKRGVDRHGSCGVGINETVERSIRRALGVGDLLDPNRVREYLDWMMGDYVPERLEELGITRETDERRWEYLHSETIRESWEHSALRLIFCPNVVFADDYTALERYDEVVFEGNQGLLLDQSYDEFHPHLTRANTGTRDVREILVDCDIDVVEICYVMRSYMTRHGNGPFPTHDPLMSFPDDTNAPNEWQGAMRFGALDAERVGRAIQDDFRPWLSTGLSPSIAVTHLDQVSSMDIALDVFLKRSYASVGPTRDHIIKNY